jgi:HEPN domain-containing protein
MPDTELAREWLIQSDRDLRGARQLVGGLDPLYDLAAFLAQQAAETALKGFLAAHGVTLEKTHDLSRLLDLAHPIEPGLARFADMADRLSVYVALTRYPDEGPFIPGADDAEEAITAAAEILQFVRERLGVG